MRAPVVLLAALVGAGCSTPSGSPDEFHLSVSAYPELRGSFGLNYCRVHLEAEATGDGFADWRRVSWRSEISDQSDEWDESDVAAQFGSGRIRGGETQTTFLTTYEGSADWEVYVDLEWEAEAHGPGGTSLTVRCLCESGREDCDPDAGH